MNITVMSGKGGVGKSMISSSLLHFFSRDNHVVGIDCDVDAPNLAIWLGIDNENPKNALKTERISTTEKPVIDKSKCIGCGLCVNKCQFKALELINKKASLIQHRCEGCGLCEVICPHNAIKLEPVENVTLSVFETKSGIPVIQGQISPGEAESGEAVTEIREIAKQYQKENTVFIQDAAAGIGCPVIASIVGSDYAVIVAEPTMSSESDMKRAIELLNQFSIPYGIVVNKYDINLVVYNRIKEFAKDKFLGKIPYNKDIVKELVKMNPVIESNLEIVKELEQVYISLKKKIGE
jgi:MinD superfamily P-loop ATPase